MDKILVVGIGKVGKALSRALATLEQIELTLFNRDSGKAIELAEELHVNHIKKLSDGQDYDLCILSVTDDAIKEVSGEISKIHPGLPIVHTAGSQPINIIQSNASRGLFYPLDSFGYSWEEEMIDTPLLIDGDNDELIDKLEGLAEQISDHVHRMDFEQRKYIHLAAVWVNNFSNACVDKGLQILNQRGVDSDILNKLISTTFLKITEQGAHNSQTGPAIRGDQSTMNQHLSLMQDEKDKNLYQLLSQMINSNHNL